MTKPPDPDWNVTTVKVLPSAAVKPLLGFRLSVPARVALPPMASWLYPLPGVVPPTLIASVPPAVWVYLPVTLKVPAAEALPGRTVPALLRSPLRVPVPDSVPPLRLRVPPMKLPTSRVAPVAIVVAPAFCTQLPAKLRSPLCTSIVPVLMKVMKTDIWVVPVPDLISVPAWLKWPPPSVWPFLMVKVAPARLLTVPLPPRLKLPLSCQIVAPDRLRVPPLNDLSLLPSIIRVAPTGMLTVPFALLMLPPVQSSSPVTVKVPLPCRLPLAMVNVAAVTLPAMFSVANVPDCVSRPAPLNVEPLPSVIVPPLKARVPPFSAIQAPELLPPPPSRSTPLCTSTVPLLFSAGPKAVVPMPATLLLVSVPALRNRALPLRSLSDLRLNVPVLVLVIVGVLLRPTFAVLVTFTVPLFVRLPFRVLPPPLVMSSVPLAGMTVATVRVPLFQVKAVGVRVPAPLMVPLSSCRLDTETLPLTVTVMLPLKTSKRPLPVSWAPVLNV